MEADRKYSASASSSDEDDHRRACRKKTRQYLSASQLALWREVLRQEIEEDLQRQVRDRLGLDCLRKPTQHPSEEKEVVMLAVGRRRKSVHKGQVVERQSVVSEVACSPSTQVEQLQQCSDRAKGVHRVSDQTHIVRAGDHVTSVRKERPGHVALREYVSSKYGVPVKQLVCLLAEGAVQTKAVDTSGCGRGPVVHVPTEANILLPTPSHDDHVITTPPLPTTDPNLTGPHMTTPTSGHVTAVLCNGPLTSSITQPPFSSTSDHSHSHTNCKHSLTCYSLHCHNDRPNSIHSGIASSLPGLDSTECSSEGLRFEARFEGGNLHRAEQIGAFEYNLWLNFDLYSSKHTQWFYFRVEGMVAMTTYTFHIVNLYKADSLYNYGMQPLLHSHLEEKLGKGGWCRVGVAIRYAPTPCTKYYTLSWSMEFPHTGDVCHIAHCYPYPYSRLLHLLDTLQSCPQRGRHVKRESLCKTLAGNDCPLVTITDFENSEEGMLREGVVVSARVHPGETNSSWMMEGLLSMLTADTPHAKALRSVYVFKLVPMLNPDGVVVGNYRTSLAGVDLNRVYKNTRAELFPTVAHTKAMVDSLMSERKVVLYVDLHGHSRKHNVFMYGCHDSQSDHTHFLKERLFPFILSQQAPHMFSFASCKFAVQRCKESTGRVVMWRHGIPNSFTMEATFCGSTLGHNPQFTSDDLMEMGRLLGEAMFRHYQLTISKSSEDRVLGQLADVIMRSALPDLVTTHTGSVQCSGHRAARKSLRRFMKFDTDQIVESSTSGSDSENDEFEFQRRKATRTRRSKHRPSLHTRTQPLLPSLPPLQPHPPCHSQPSTSQPLHQAKPHSKRRQSIPAARSCVPLPPLTRFSAPPRLTSVERKCQNWKFIDKYKGRSNGGIPMFSAERMRERAERRLHSVSQPPSTERADENPVKTCAEKKTQHTLPIFWQHSIGEDLEQARQQGPVELTVAKQPLTTLQEQQWMQQYNGLRHQLFGKRGRGRGESQLPPALTQFIRELWSKQ